MTAAVQKHVGVLMLLLSCALAQDTAGTATVQSVNVIREGAYLRLEVTLSSPVKPSVWTAIHPDRILLDLPDTICTGKTKQVEIHANGVRRVRTAQHSTTPLVTRVVLDLDQARTYSLKSEGNRIILLVSSTAAARGDRPAAPVAATSGSLIGLFRRRSGASASTTGTLPVAE